MSAALRVAASLSTALLVSGGPALRGAPPARRLSQLPENPYLSDIFANCPHELLVVHLRTELYGHEISWEFVPERGRHNENHAGHHTDHYRGQDEPMCAGSGEADQTWYDTACCLPAGNYTLVCSDLYGDAWNGGYLTIGGVEYCRDDGYQGDDNRFHHGYRMEISLHIAEQTTVTQTSTTPHTTTETATATTSTETSSTTHHTTTVTNTETSTTSLHTTTATATSRTYVCQDDPWWFDSAGHQFDCAWYGSPEQQRPGDRCKSDGHLFEHFGRTANQACCVCRESVDPTPSPTEMPQSCAVDAVHVQVYDLSPDFAWEIVSATTAGPYQQHWDISLWNDELQVIPAAICSGPAGSHSEDYERSARSCCLPPGEYFLRCQSNAWHHGLHGQSVTIDGVELCGAWGDREHAVRFQVEESGFVRLTGGPTVPFEPNHCQPHEVTVNVHAKAAKFEWEIVPYGGPYQVRWDIHNWDDVKPSIPRPVCSRPKGTYPDFFSASSSCCVAPGEYAIRCSNSAGLQGETVWFNGQQLCNVHGPAEYATLFHAR